MKGEGERDTKIVLFSFELARDCTFVLYITPDGY